MELDKVKVLQAEYRAANGSIVVIDPVNDQKLKTLADQFISVPMKADVLGYVTDLVRQIANHGAQVTHGTYDSIQIARNGIYTSGRGRALLGELISNGNVMCRERAIFLHVLLAQLNGDSKLKYGEKTDGKKHLWVEMTPWQLDPMKNLVGTSDADPNFSVYSVHRIFYQLVEPKR